MKFLGCLIFLLFGFLFIIIAFFGNFIKLFYKLHKANKQFKKATENTQKEQTKANNDSYKRSSRHENKEKGKIFSKNEGEYVDFEEVK